MKKIGGIIADILLFVFIVFATIITVVALNTKDKGVTNIYGYVPLNIQTDSMKPTIKPGDLIVTKKYNGEEMKVNDIISFFTLEQ